MRFVLPSAHRPRNTLARIALSIIGLAILGVLVVFGLIAAGVLLAVGAVALLVRQWKLSRQPSRQRPHARAPWPGEAAESDTQSDVLEGEFVVVDHKHSRR